MAKKFIDSLNIITWPRVINGLTISRILLGLPLIISLSNGNNDLFIFIFLIAGATSGWTAVQFLPESFLQQVLLPDGLLEKVATKEDLRLLLCGLGALFGLIIGFSLQQFRKNLIRKV